MPAVRAWKIGVLVLAATVVTMAVKPVRADDHKARRGANLRQCLQLSDRNHPNILQARAKLAFVRAQLTEAYSAPFMQFKATGGVALAPTILGNNVYSPNTDQSLTSSLGLGWRIGITGVLPVWTFGKITNLWDAAEANVNVNEASMEVTRDAVRFDVRKAYLGLQLARDGLALLKEAQRGIDDAVRDLKKRVDDDDADPIDLLKLQTFAVELKIRASEAGKFVKVTQAGLRFYTGVPNLTLRDEPLERSAHQLGHLSKYLRAARRLRPDVAMAKAGVEARAAQVRLSRSRMFPDFGVAISVGYSAAPEVSNQINPFSKDPANFFAYSAALVFQWKLDFVPGFARIAQAEAQLQEVMALDKKALGGVAAQVEEAHAEAEDWKQRLEAYEEAQRYAKQWLATVKQAIDIGTMEDDELIEPAKAYAQYRYSVLNATMEYNLALAKLAQRTGWDAIAPGG